MTATRHLVFRKTIPTMRAAAETAGWHTVAATLVVPALLAVEHHAGARTLIYEDVFSTGRCRQLLGDVIAEADRNRARIPDVIEIIDAICRDLIRSTEQTGRPAALGDCVPGLYLDRIRPGGRLDSWYGPNGPQLALPGLLPTAVSELTVQATINGTRLRIDPAASINYARDTLTPDSRWQTGITQGDPTEPNIAAPMCWLDFEYAGRNTLPGEIANLLWYLIALGGWLVPRYQPDVYARTLHRHLPPVATPTITHLTAATGRFDLAYTWHVGVGRHAAISSLTSWIHGDLGRAAALDATEPIRTLRPFLTTRALGVIPLAQLDSRDALLVLAKLAELHHPAATLATLTDTCPFNGRNADDTVPA